MSFQEIQNELERTPSVATILTSSRIRFDTDAIAGLPARIGMIATCSVGYDHIDVDAANRRGIVVTNTPDVVSEATADMALFLMLGACRRGREYMAIMDQGWRQRFGLSEMLGLDFHGKTLGILGMGRIGQAVARRARGFGIKIIYHNRRRLDSDLERALGIEYYGNFFDMLPHCQLLSLHLPGTAELAGLINADVFSRMPKGAVLINTSRGLLVDENDLIDALGSGQLAAAGLDVFCKEPEYDLRLRDLPNLFMMPHMGTATVETREAMGHRALDNVRDFFAGTVPRDRL